MSPRLPTLRCLRCGWTWHPRQVKVWVCPRCHSPKWNTPKETKS